MPIPIIANIIPRIMITTAKMITATMAITSALSHPQSKKCLISASQTISKTIVATKLFMNVPTSVFMIDPRKTIQSASVNFALSFPAIRRPEIQSAGERSRVVIIICIIAAMMSIV